MRELAHHANKLEFYAEGNEKPLGSFKQENGKNEFAVQDNHSGNRPKNGVWEASQEDAKTLYLRKLQWIGGRGQILKILREESNLTANSLKGRV